MQHNHEPVNEEYERRETTSGKTGIALRTEIAQQLFKQLSDDDQNDWERQGRESWLDRCEKYRSRMEGSPSTDPEEQDE